MRGWGFLNYFCHLSAWGGKLWLTVYEITMTIIILKSGRIIRVRGTSHKKYAEYKYPDDEEHHHA
jgi:hypothetical protein